MSADVASSSGAVKDNFIRIGDLISLKIPKIASFFSAEGILSDEVYVSPSVAQFEEHLFQVYVQRQYSATNELEEFLEFNNLQDVDVPLSDPSLSSHREALLRGKDNESVLNRSVMKSKLGNIVCFGDTIQLLHVKSHKFVTVRPADLARDERENMRVTLSHDGSVMSWIKMMPRFKIDREGEPLSNGTEVLLRVSERSNEFLHCADRAPPKGKFREINSSMESPTGWKIGLYHKESDVRDAAKLLAGQLISIRDPELQCMIAPIARSINLNYQRPESQPGQLRDSTFFQSPFHQASALLHMNSHSAEYDEASQTDDGSISSFDEFVREFGTVVLRPIHEDTVDSDAIWMLESRSIVKAGPIQHQTDRVHLRHLNTGKYLSVRALEGEHDKFILCLDDKINEKHTLFHITELHSSSEFLHNTKAVQIKHAHLGVFLHRGLYDDEHRVYSLSTTRSQNKAVSVIVNRYEQKESVHGPKSAHREEETLDVYFGRAVMYHLDKFVRGTMQLTVRHDTATIWPRIDITDRANFAVIMARALLFVRGFPIHIQRMTDEMVHGKGGAKYIKLRRQHMLREQGLLQALIVMIQHLQPISDVINNDVGHHRASKSPFVEHGREVLSECLTLLYYLIHHNAANQLYIADHFLIIFAHVSTEKMAAKIAQELLSSNRELQETKIGHKEITIFAEKMREVHMNAMYLQLLRTCCSCMGEALPKNQEIVKDVLYHKVGDVLIRAKVDVATSFMVDWGRDSFAFEFFLAPKLNGKAIKGLSLFTKGIPAISLHWDVRSSRHSAVQLFKKENVPLSEVMLITRLHNNKALRGGNGSTGDELRRSIADFYIAQLHLAGEMCLGRNYPVIVEMEKIYSYELLISILKSSNSDSLQGSAAYLLQHLYVDRDPQTVVHVPRLTRILADAQQSSQLVNVSSPDGDQFALLQVIIAHHLDSVRGKPFPQHSLNMLGLLHALIQFNFYGSVPALRETIESLHGCLVRGAFDIEADTDGGALSSSMLKISASNHNSSSAKSSSRRTLNKAKDPNKSVASMASSQQSFGDLSEADYTSNNKDESRADKSEGDITPKPSTAASTSRENAKKRKSAVEIASMILQIIESIPGQAVHLLIAMVGAAAALYNFFNPDAPHYIKVVQNSILVAYLARLSVRYLLFCIVQVNAWMFFLRWENWLDIGICLLYASSLLRPNSYQFGLVRLGELGFVASSIKAVYSLRNAAQLSARRLSDNTNQWTVSARYVKTPSYTLSTLVRIVDILNSVQMNLDDRRVSLFLKRFDQWARDPKASLSQCRAVFEAVLEESNDLAVSSDQKDDTLIDVLMYASPPLVQSTLNLLMSHHSSRKVLLDNINKLQLITTPEDQQTYFRLEKIVSVAKRDVDTHEIWGKLETPEFRAINAKMFDALLSLTAECKRLRETLKFDESHEPIKFIQNVLRNLGCFEVCIKVAQLILHVDKDDIHSEVAVNTRKLALAGNHLLYWLILDNPSNQSLAYSELKFFIRTIDNKIDSHRVISAIFRDNIDLMELVPKKYISEFVDNICNIGKFPQYLSLMGSILSVGEKNVIGNQYAVIKLMSSPENQKKLVQFFVPRTHPEYAKKIRLMSHYLSVKDVGVHDLPSDLAYHLELMKLLSACTIGRTGMTTIEAKVQSMFHFVDVIDAMLDPQCLLLAKIRLGQFLYNAVMDVETPVPAVKDAACVWQLLIAAQDVFAFAKDELRQIEKNGWDASSSSRQKIEYMIVNAMNIESYFTAYFDRTIFKPEIGQTAAGVERMTLKEQQGNEIIRSLFQKISAIYEMVSPLLQLEHHEILFRALVALNNAAREKIVNVVENVHESLLRAAEEYNNEGVDRMGRAFDEFVSALNESEEVKTLLDEQIQHFIRKIEEVPWKAQAAHAAVAFEPLIEKMVSHVRSCVKVIVHGDESVKFMEVPETKTSIWILKILRTMIENRWGMSIYERDDDGGEEQDDAVVDLMRVYGASGVTEMCLDLIARGLDISLQAEALKLLVGMLFKEGGATDIQKTIHAHLSQPGSDMFFRTVRHILHNLMSWHKWNGVIVLEEDQEPQLPDEIIIVRCLQLMCEGHFLPNQDIFREQPHNHVSINILDDLVLYLQCLDPIPCKTSTTAELAVAATVLEVIQGPCEGNQDYFALNTELIETLNRKLRQHPVHDCDESQELELKKACIDIFQALLEGQGHKTAVYERMLSVIHVDVILVLCKGEGGADEEEKEDGENGAAGGKEKDKEEKEESEESAALRTESLVLLQMLTDFRPSLRAELGLQEDEDFSKLGGDSVACIEIVWHGELQRRFFSVPELCRALAQSTKDDFILNVKRSSPEDKLFGLLLASKEMYREVLHQQLLRDLRLDMFFSKNTIDRTVWTNFYLTLAINLLFILFYSTKRVSCDTKGDYNDALLEYQEIYYSADDDSQTVVDTFCSKAYLTHDAVHTVLFALTLVLICGASFALLGTVVVRGPVRFRAYREADMGFLRSVLYAGLDWEAFYYQMYLMVAVVGIFYHPALSVLLLDFVKISPMTQAVLRAVYNPRKQLFFTLVLTFILLYIFAMWQFFFVNGPQTFTDYPTYVTLGNLYKFVIRWGLPFNSPANQMVMTIYSARLISDVAFFLTCLIMLNILKGITIDTFVELRKALEERVADTTEKCFICGIEKNTFNRTLDRTAFRTHITQDQNLWNYLYFIMYLWEQDKDDDDGLESYVRRCIDEKDLVWFPMNKAIRLAEHQEKGDVHSLKYRFRRDAQRSESVLSERMAEFKEQVSRTLSRVEKALEYEHEETGGRRSRTSSRSMSVSFSAKPSTPLVPSALSSARDDVPVRVSTLLSALDEHGNTSTGVGTGSSSAGESVRESTLSIAPKPLSPPMLHQKSVSFSLGRTSTALDADNAGQMHVRVAYISGMVLNPSYLCNVCVKVITEFQTTMLFPLPDVQLVESLSIQKIAQAVAEAESSAMNTTTTSAATAAATSSFTSKSVERVSTTLRNARSSFSMAPQAFSPTRQSVEQQIMQRKAGTDGADPTLSQVQLRFDTIDTAPTLVHQGSLPKADLSKIMVKIQVLYGTHINRRPSSSSSSRGAVQANDVEDNNAELVFLGGVNVPLIHLIARAHDGALLEVPFKQREVDIQVPVSYKDTNKASASSAAAVSPPSSSPVVERERYRTVTLPERENCVIGLSPVAAHKLLQDFAFLRS